MLDRRDFAGKLGQALKALNISRGRLAAEARVDKSLVSRWLRGVSAPRGHNLEAVTTVLATYAPGFSQLSWDLPTEAFGRLFGAGSRAAVPSGGEVPDWIMPGDYDAADLRGPTYEGFWRITHPSITRPDVFFHRYARIRRESGGLCHLTWVSGQLSYSGPLFIVHDQLYAVTRDKTDGVFAFLILHGVTAPNAEFLDGVVFLTARAQRRPISACTFCMERIATLSGDRQADDERLDALRAAPMEADDIAGELKRHLMREAEPMSTLDHAVLRLTAEASRSRGRIGGPPP